MKRRVSSPLWMASLSGLLLCGCSDGGDGPQGQAQALIHLDNAEQVSSVVGTLGVLATNSDLFLIATQAPAATTTEPCPGGGSVEYGFVIDVDPMGVVSTGDRLVVDYDLCRDGDNHLDGTLGFDFVTVTGTVVNGDVFDVEMDLGVENLLIEGPEVAITVNGLVSTMVTGDYSGGLYTLAGWTLATHTKGNDTYDESLSDCMITCDVDDLPGGARVRTVTLDGKLTNDALLPGTQLQIVTVVPLVAFDGQNPYVGELLLTADDDSTLRIIVVDDTSLELQLDTDGDETVDYVLEVPWAEM